MRSSRRSVARSIAATIASCKQAIRFSHTFTSPREGVRTANYCDDRVCIAVCMLFWQIAILRITDRCFRYASASLRNQFPVSFRQSRDTSHSSSDLFVSHTSDHHFVSTRRARHPSIVLSLFIPGIKLTRFTNCSHHRLLSSIGLVLGAWILSANRIFIKVLFRYFFLLTVRRWYR